MAANPMISNGTCYWAAGEETDSVFIPCGNDVFGHQPCCQAGDKCVSSKACYNSKYGITYLAGCSDPDYLDENCPVKPGLDDSPWVGLVTCAGSNLWSPCSQHGNPSTLRSADPCTCNTASPVIAFTDAQRLTDRAYLPTALGQSVVWAPGFLPTSTTRTSSAAPSTISSSTSSTSIAAPPTLTSPLPPPPPPTTQAPTQTPTQAASALPQVDPPIGMSTGTKAGIGVGVSAAVLIILAGVFAHLFMRRRRKKSAAAEVHQPVPTDGHDHPGEAKYAWSPSTVATARVGELDSQPARPWSLRSELEGRDHNSPASINAAFGDDKQKEAGSPGPQGHQTAQSQPPQGLGVFAELQG